MTWQVTALSLCSHTSTNYTIYEYSTHRIVVVVVVVVVVVEIFIHGAVKATVTISVHSYQHQLHYI